MCFDTDDSWNFEIREFYDGITRGRPVINGTINDAVAVMELIDKVYGNKDDVYGR